MSEPKRVLIVDDHKEIRTTLRANLEALEENLEVVDVPSGEEAILEAAGDQIDLMIADVGLPGLSGLELMDTIQERYPKTKIILVTGLEDEDIRRRVADAGTAAFFLKPVQVPELLKSIKRSLGLKEQIPGDEDSDPLETDLLSEDVSKRMDDLRGELGAISIILLSREEKIVAKSGGLPDAVYETQVIPELLNSFQSVNKISSFLGMNRPRSQWYFSGEKYDLFWSHVGRKYGMLVVTNPIIQNTDLTWVMTTINLAVKETLRIILALENDGGKESHLEDQTPQEKIQKGKPSSEKDQKPQEKDHETREKPSFTEAESPRREEPSQDLFDIEADVEKSEVDTFWDDAVLDEEGVENPDALTYEEAQKLGFIPEENNEGA